MIPKIINSIALNKLIYAYDVKKYSKIVLNTQNIKY